jgi:hypothetical protein
MNASLFRANKEEVTNSPPRSPVVTKFPSFGWSDPVASAENEEKVGCVNIRHGAAVLRVRNLSFKIVDPYASKEEQEQAERGRNGGYTNEEIQKCMFSLYARTYLEEPAITFSMSPIQRPSWQVEGKTITGNDGRRYREILDKETGKTLYIEGQNECINPNSDRFKAENRTIQSLRSDEDHFNIKYKFVNGQFVERTPEEMAMAATFADIDNSYTKLPLQLDMIRIITNEVTKPANEGSFKLSAPSGIKTDAVPTADFAPAASQLKPVEGTPTVFRAPSALERMLGQTPANTPKLEIPA